MDDQPQSFSYDFLDSDKKQIRVLRCQIEPFRNEPTGVLHFECRTIQISGQDIEKYYAISYVWGDVNEIGEIVLDGKPIRVPRSAECALRGVLQGLERTAAAGPAFLWIDAICMNQQDMDEKSSQVAMMSEIYSRAQCTLIWFGECDDSTTAAFDTMRALAEDCSKHTRDDPDPPINNRDTTKEPTQRESYREAPMPPDCDWDAFSDFLGRPWFERLWVLQEVILSQDVYCFCGDQHVSWSTFSMAVRWTMHRRAGGWPNIVYHGTSTFESVTRLMRADTICLKRLKPHEQTFSGLLSFNLGWKCSIPHDRIFAVLGLLDADRRPMQPDYSRPVKDIYADATYHAIMDSKTLMLSTLGATAIMNELDEATLYTWPTWVMRWHTFTKHRERVQRAGGILATACERDVSNHERADVSRPGNGDTLRVSGVFLGEVQGSWRPSTENLRPRAAEDSRHPVQAALAEFLVPLLEPGPWTESVSLWTPELIASVAQALPHWTTHQEYEHNVADFAALLLDSATRHLNDPNDKLIQVLLNCGAGNGNAETCARFLSPDLGQYVLFRLDHGQVGATPNLSCGRKGDLVFILFGCNVPVIMSRDGTGWKLQGAARIPSLEKGQYMQQLGAEGRLEEETQTFDIV